MHVLDERSPLHGYDATRAIKANSRVFVTIELRDPTEGLQDRRNGERQLEKPTIAITITDDSRVRLRLPRSLPADPSRFDLITGYTRRFGRFTWATQLNVYNLFNHS